MRVGGIFRGFGGRGLRLLGDLVWERNCGRDWGF